MKTKLPYFVKSPTVVILLVALALIAFYFPAEAAPGWLESFAKAIAAIFPPIEAYASKSEFSAATSTYMVFAFLLFPLHLFYSFKELRTNDREVWFDRLWNIRSTKDLVGRLFLIPLAILLAFFTLFVNPGYDFNLLPLNSSRAALAFGGWLVAGAIPAWCLSWSLCNVIAVGKYFLNGEAK